MTYLLDISTLMALLWGTHEHNARATDWQNWRLWPFVL